MSEYTTKNNTCGNCSDWNYRSQHCKSEIANKRVPESSKSKDIYGNLWLRTFRKFGCIFHKDR